MVKKWIQTVAKKHKRGALHKQLKIPQGETIPKTLVNRIVESKVGSKVKNPTSKGKKRIKVTTLLKRRAVFAKNAGYKK